MLWIKEVQMAKLVDDLVTSRSIGGYVFPNFELFDAKIAFASKRIISNWCVRRRIDVEDQSSSTRQISSRRTDFSHDLRTFPSYWRS